MAFDGIITNSIIFEILPILRDSKIDKIQMPNNNEIVLSFHTRNGAKKLLISIDPSYARFHITKYQKENPPKAPQFCMILRKYLQGAKLSAITQLGLDRVISLELENYNELGDLVKYTLNIELMGKYSNIILVNESNKILDSIKHVDASMSSVREVLPARDYIQPTTLNKQSFINMSYETFVANLQVACMDPYFSKENIAKFVANQFVGFSKTFVNNLFEATSIKDTFTKQNTLELFNLITIVLMNSSNHMLHFEMIGNDYHINLNDFSTTINNQELSEFLDDYYHKKELSQNLITVKYNLSKDVETIKNKFTKNLKRVNEVLAETKDMEKFKLYGELLTTNMYKLSQGMENVTVENYYDNNSPITIPLNSSKSPSYNTQAYFKKYNKLKNAISHSTTQKEEYEKNIDYLDSVLFTINESETLQDLSDIRLELENSGYLRHSVNKKKYKDEEKLPPYNYTFEGVTILAGRNNLQNDKLTLKESKKSYTWLHVKDFHGSHVIIQSDSPSNKVIEFAATIAKKHSEAKESSKVSVDYTLVKNVHKPSGSMPGKVIYTDYKTIII